MKQQRSKRIGYFSRLLDEVAPAERYRLGVEQMVHAERCGYHTAWVAQHHFHENEGGLPAPFVVLAQVAARTTRLRLGTGIITLPLELPVRVAEDASVLDLISGGRLELGIGPGGNLTAFRAFGLDSAQRHSLYSGHADLLRDALAGRELPGGDRLYPANPSLAGRIWQATFSVEGGSRAGAAGDGLLLSRTQPRGPGISLSDLQNPIIDAYLAALPPGVAPRILASRSVIVTDDRKEAMEMADIGLQRAQDRLISIGRVPERLSTADMIASFDVHLGTPEDVIASLRTDSAIDRATDVAVQVHSVDPPHPYILRSIELFAGVVAPAFGWGQDVPVEAAA